MGNHTPGPWSVSSMMHLEDINKTSGTYGIKVSPNGHWIAKLHPLNGIVESGDELRANARLIAAAPEMLDMLIELQESAQYWSEYDVPVGIVDRLNVVISKAKGE